MTTTLPRKHRRITDGLAVPMGPLRALDDADGVNDAPTGRHRTKPKIITLIRRATQLRSAAASTLDAA
ncbi:hypothetical protein [Litorihabitans aurantiacus]|uniref:Uncharacterized protein n=1 Tax=Litorihabitans aurantiacus TaxID=1930061 RepID=A0AA38CT85_9MICO|nr:hypothetical protein [Litorihabitans aurantiacus]GMA31572.1 hypothetical protein GCM10025875_15640 [Litorihabitans aurantiacus]